MLVEKATVVEDEQQEMVFDADDDVDDDEMNEVVPNDPEKEPKVDNVDIEPEVEVTTSDLTIQEVCD